MCTVEISYFHLRIIMLLITTHRTLTLSDLKFTPWIRMQCPRKIFQIYIAMIHVIRIHIYILEYIYLFPFKLSNWYTIKLFYQIHVNLFSRWEETLVPQILFRKYLINCLHFQFTMLNTNKRLLFITPLTDIKENL